jgi:Cu/Ag efflux protein CusF
VRPEAEANPFIVREGVDMKLIGSGTIGRILAGLLAVMLGGPAVSADKAQAAKEGRGVAEVVKVTATVDAVDQATRSVTLKNEKGEKVTFVAGPEVRNLAQLKKGDVVTMEYMQAVAVKLAKSSSSVRERTVTEGIERAAPGQKPGGVALREVKVVASVEKIDAKKNIVTLRGPQATVDIKVQDPAMLKGVKVGDFVEATYTEAVAINVAAGK